jgi:hypothetical protein
VIIIAAAQYQQKEDYVSSSNLCGSPAARDLEDHDFVRLTVAETAETS